MTYAPHASRPARAKLIHSNICFVAVPLGLCALAGVIHWLAALAN